jgi:hypothetical protein
LSISYNNYSKKNEIVKRQEIPLLDLFPELKQAAVAFRGQFSQQAPDLSQYPQPFFGHGVPERLQRSSPSTAHMEPAYLMLQSQLVRH